MAATVSRSISKPPPLPTEFPYYAVAATVLSAIGLCFGFVSGFQTGMSQGPLLGLVTGFFGALLGLGFGWAASALRCPRWLFNMLLAALSVGLICLIQSAARWP